MLICNGSSCYRNLSHKLLIELCISILQRYKLQVEKYAPLIRNLPEMLLFAPVREHKVT